HGVPVARHPELVAARGTSRRRVERLQARREALIKARVRPTVPATLAAGVTGGPPASTKRKGEGDGPAPGRRVKGDPSTDHRKRKVGDEGEQWALAATLADLVALTSHGRERAIDDLSAFLVRHFEGNAVDELVEHGVRARSEVEDDEEFIHHAARML